jgi:hypothetical protein
MGGCDVTCGYDKGGAAKSWKGTVGGGMVGNIGAVLLSLYILDT